MFFLFKKTQIVVYYTYDGNFFSDKPIFAH